MKHHAQCWTNLLYCYIRSPHEIIDEHRNQCVITCQILINIIMTSTSTLSHTELVVCDPMVRVADTRMAFLFLPFRCHPAYLSFLSLYLPIFHEYFPQYMTHNHACLSENDVCLANASWRHCLAPAGCFRSITLIVWKAVAFAYFSPTYHSFLFNS